MFATAEEALKYIANNDLAMVDLKVTGITGRWMHITIPASNFSAKHFTEGVGYDGSSGSGFTNVESGDVVARPDPATAFIDPFWELPTISFLCETVTADTRAPFSADPRSVAQRAVAYMKNSGMADEAWMGPEYEFHILDSVDVVNRPYDTQVRIVSSETETAGALPGIPTKGGYMRIAPTDRSRDIRSEIAVTLQNMGVGVRYHHHEVGAPGQCEIEIDLLPLLDAADQTMLIQYVIKNVAHRHGKLATFMPKPIFGEAGNGMHVHQKLHKDGKNLFFDGASKNYADLSDTALHYIGGLLIHGRGLTGLTNPSTNSFKRLVEGLEAPVNLFFSLANRSAAIRVPRYAVSADEKRIEYRPPDFTGNIYLTLAAMLMAGLDGIRSRVDCAAHNFGPFDVDIAKQSEEFRRRITPIPRTLSEALTALEQDHAFLVKGEVFAESFIRNWIDAKRRNEVRTVATHPHPFEYELYLDV